MASTHNEPQRNTILLSNGLRMQYYQWPGTGPNLVFLHPSSGYGRMWEMTAECLSGQFQIFALDQRGHGDTDKPDGAYTAEEYAEDLRLFIEEAGVERPIIAGHSLGGRVAQVFAATYPQQVTAIALVGGPHYENFFQERDRVNTVLEGVQRMRVSETEFSSEEEALAFLRDYRPTDTDDMRRHRIAHNMSRTGDGRLSFKFDKVRVAQGLTHIADDLKPYARRVTCPVAILRGTNSSHLSRHEAEEVASFWNDSRVIEVEGDYTLELENPQGLAQAIMDFARAATPA